MAWRGEVEDGSGWGGLVASKSEQREEARLAALERDAARYRWLRDRMAVGDMPEEHPTWSTPSEHESATFDSEVDARMNGANTWRRRLEELRYLRGLAENKNLPTLMRDTLRNAAAEIERLHTALVAITNVPVGTVLTAHQMRMIAKNAIAT